ncbi:MAG: hypothetical protein ACYC62_06655, partial [Coriobacteriia bacterium]
MRGPTQHGLPPGPQPSPYLRYTVLHRCSKPDALERIRTISANKERLVKISVRPFALILALALGIASLSG